MAASSNSPIGHIRPLLAGKTLERRFVDRRSALLRQTWLLFRTPIKQQQRPQARPILAIGETLSETANGNNVFEGQKLSSLGAVVQQREDVVVLQLFAAIEKIEFHDEC